MLYIFLNCPETSLFKYMYLQSSHCGAAGKGSSVVPAQVATEAWVRCLAWEIPYAMGVAKKTWYMYLHCHSVTLISQFVKSKIYSPRDIYYLSLCVCVYIYMYVYIYVYIYVCVCVCVCVCARKQMESDRIFKSLISSIVSR